MDSNHRVLLVGSRDGFYCQHEARSDGQGPASAVTDIKNCTITGVATAQTGAQEIVDTLAMFNPGTEVLFDSAMHREYV